MSPPLRRLGTQGLQVSALGLGCMGLSAGYQPTPTEQQGIDLIKHAYERGVTFFDTSDLYGPFTNEVLVGKALKLLPRDKIQLATKFGALFENGDMVIRGTREYARKACEESLKRLDVDYIDLYYQHRIDTTVPIEETSMFEEYDEFLNRHKRDFHGRDSALKHYIKSLSKSKILIYHNNLSEEGTLATFFFKTMSRFLGGAVIPGSYEKVILVEKVTALTVFGYQPTISCSRRGYFLAYTAFALALGIENVEELLTGPYGKNRLLRHKGKTVLLLKDN